MVSWPLSLGDLCGRVLFFQKDNFSVAICLSTDDTKLLSKGVWQTVLSFKEDIEWGPSLLMKVIIIFKVTVYFIY